MAVQINEDLFNSLVSFMSQHPAVAIWNGLAETAKQHNSQAQGELSGQMQSRKLPDMQPPPNGNEGIPE